MSKLTDKDKELFDKALVKAFDRPLWLGLEWYEYTHAWHEFDFPNYKRIPFRLDEQITIPHPSPGNEWRRTDRVRIWDAETGGNDLAFYDLHLDPGDTFTLMSPLFKLID